MKNIIILLIGLLLTNLSFSQKKVIEITNPNSTRVVIIKENRRIKIKTFDGKKIKGKFKILDNENILIKNRRIKLTDIQKIKRNPLLLTVATATVLVSLGYGLLFASIIVFTFTSESLSLLLIIPASGMIYGGIKSANLLKGYKNNSNWKYEIKTISE